MPRSYYNEIEPYCVEWLKNLIAANLIPPGDVDPRPIQEVKPSDLKGYTQCHFFVGIAGWPYALRLAGWPDSRPIWTGSCPCQPFSVAGKRKGKDDPRHLWPHFLRLIRTATEPPACIMGEQVAGTDGYDWLDGVAVGLEESAYSFRAIDIPACGVNAPHRRNRLYWVAHPEKLRQREQDDERGTESRQRPRGVIGGSGSRPERMAHTNLNQLRQVAPAGKLPDDELREGLGGVVSECCPALTEERNFWSSYILIGPDRKHKYRRIEPSTFPVAPRVPETMAQLRAFGNAIAPPLAEQVIRAYLDCYPSF